MKKEKNTVGNLHQKAEKLLKIRHKNSTSQKNETDPLKLIHELEVHQIVLEMQAEDLKYAKENAESESEKFRLLANLTTTGIFITDKDGKFTYVNPAWCQMTGLTPEEALGEGWLRGIFSEDRGYIRDSWKEFISGKSNWNCEYRFQKRQGKISSVYSIATPIRDFDGNIIGYVGDNYDITTNKINEKALRESEIAYRSIFENSVSGISQSSPDGELLRINQAYAEMYCYPDTSTMLREIRSNIINLYANSSDRQRVLNILDKNGYMAPTEFELRRRNGGKFWAMVGARKVTDYEGNLLYYQAEHIDINSLKKAEEKWKESEEKYRSLSDQSGLGIGLFSPDGKIIYFNKKAMSNLGAPNGSFIGKSLSDIFDKETSRIYINRFKEVIRSGKSIEYEDFFESESGKYWFLSSQSRICDSTGKLLGIQVIAHDITERKIIEKKLQESTDELRDLTHHFGEKIEKERTIISRDLHDDLGQKLTALNMDIAWLKSRIGVQSRTVEKKLHQMQSLISDTIENVQRISYGLRPSILDDLGLQAAIEWQLKEFHRKSGIKVNSLFDIENEISDSQKSLVVFRIVQEALTNILRHAGATAIDVKVKVRENAINAIITDNGSGIEQEKVVSKKSFGLIGMRERVKAYEGVIKISGKKGLGTEIFVKIPL